MDYFVHILIWEISIFIVVSLLMYTSLQRIDFSKVFKANSTRQIKSIIIVVSVALGFICALGVGEILTIIKNILNV